MRRFLGTVLVSSSLLLAGCGASQKYLDQGKKGSEERGFKVVRVIESQVGAHGVLNTITQEVTFGKGCNGVMEIAEDSWILVVNRGGRSFRFRNPYVDKLTKDQRLEGRFCMFITQGVGAENHSCI